MTNTSRLLRLGGASHVAGKRAAAAAAATTSRLLLFRPMSTVASSTMSTNRQNFCETQHSMSRTAAFFSTSTKESDKDDKKKPEGPTLSLKNQKTMEFQAETKQLLDIVTNSLYTDKEVFLRELVSNASDALEKLRHLQNAASDQLQVIDADLPLQIRITLDEVESSLTIQDTGIGMTADELVDNLGTIARSGSKNFMAQLEADQNHHDSGLDIARGIIGKFGVGFYSCFMVADHVQVTTRPARGGPITVWTSDGTGTYELAELDEGDDTRQDRGTSIKLFLKSDYWGLLSEAKIQDILTKYSNFVQFPILLNGSRVNTVQAVWSMDPKEVERETYVDFYKYIAQAIDDPLDILHFRADAPLEIQALLFVPSFHSEKYGMERMEPGVNLYSRKVLIESKCHDILPDWLRFVKGVVDSEDLPLAISREKPQDSALIVKLKKALTRRFLSQLEKMAK
jgi:HSP90 family molecular chaperone